MTQLYVIHPAIPETMMGGLVYLHILSEWVNKFVSSGKFGEEEKIKNKMKHSLNRSKHVSNFSENAFTFVNGNRQCLCKFCINLNFSFEYFPHLIFGLPFIILLHKA